MQDTVKVPGLIPDQYTKSKFWRFLLDTKAEASHPDEPRFKQFSENLRNYAVAAVMFKAAQTMGMSLHHPFLLIGRYLLIGLASVTTAFCVAQHFALIIVSFHWYVGWDPMDHIALTRDRKRRRNFKRAGIEDGWLQANLKLYSFVLVPLLCLWAMLAFLLTPSR
jgi:hypothetical protein